MTHRLIIGLAAWLLLAAPCSGKSYVCIPSDALAAYLTNPTGGGRQEATARAIVDQARIIQVRYEHPEPGGSPAEDSRFADSIQASLVQPERGHGPDGEPYRALMAIFSKLYQLSGDAASADWLEEMKRPFERGYSLAWVCVLPEPTDDVKATTAALAERAVRDVAARLEALKDEFPQVALFDPDSVTERGLSFRHGVGPPRLDDFRPIGDDWVTLSFHIAPVTGMPRQIVTRGKGYPLQATSANWAVASGDPALKERVLAAVPSALQGLDQYERELAGEYASTTEEVGAADGAPSLCPEPHERYVALVAFFRDFQTRVRAGDREGVLDRLHDAVRVTTGDDTMLLGRDEAQAAYDDLFGSDFIDRVTEIDPRRVSCDSRGMTIGDELLRAAEIDDELAIIAITR